MPNKVRRNSVVDLLAKVPVNRGSLLKSIENLLKTIESSENAVMIPTLLRDKCEFDAWELLFVAKILKASILGHSDLVEFYMNHIGHSLAAFSAQQQANGNSDQQQQQTALSPSMRRQSSPNSSPLMESNNITNSNGASSQSQSQSQTPTTPIAVVPLSTSPSLSSTSSVSSVSTTTQTSMSNGGPSKSQTTSSTNNSWMTANQQSSSISSSNGSVINDTTSGFIGSSSNQTDSSSSTSRETDSSIQVESLLAARPLLMRQAQPPSLLQLTTTNNHINSVAAVAASFTNDNIEQLTHQLSVMQTNGCLSSNNGPHGALSISTTTANQQSPKSTGNNSTTNGAATPTLNMHHSHPELRSSRSAGCLFRINSGASSPRTPIQTPTTPYPQAETLANGQLNGLLGDPSTPVKLLLQIEQLKSSISHVTNLLESVVELYKKSIDNIAMA